MTNDARDVHELRRELMRRRLAQRGLAATEPVARPRIRTGEPYPLSTGQRRMWFLQNLDPSDTTLNIGIAYRLTGDVDEARLRAAFDDVVARHSILRTTYAVDSDGEPYQVAHESIEFGWLRVDLTDLAVDERDRRVAALADAEFGRPFDLATEAPLRVTVARTAPDEVVMLLVAHHICWDDDSTAVFLTELSAAYNGGRHTGQAADFVVVVDAAAEPADTDLRYWRDVLHPVPEPLELPGAAAVTSSRAAERRTRVLPDELWRRVEDFAQDRSASPFMVLLAAFGVLTRRYTGSADFLVSIPVTQRSGAADGALGYFGNTLLLRLRPDLQDGFGTFVDSVRATCLDGFAHQSVGIDRVVREVNPQRSAGRDGMEQLVRLGFSMRKTATELALDGVSVRQLDHGAVTAQLPLALAVVRDPQATLLEFEYQTDALSAALVDAMLVAFLRLLEYALREPGRRLGALDMLGADERSAVLARSHGSVAEMPATTMVALLESAANATPEAVAVVSDDIELTYAELHRQANRLAHWLIGRGIGTEDVVGLRMTTSVKFVVAVLATLKSGAGYLPIDPAYPEDRIEYLLSDGRPRMVIGQEEFDSAEREAAHQPDTAPTDADRIRPLRPQNLAYVIYTSGSTGLPKGVAVAHHAIAEHVESFTAEWEMTSDDRLLQSSSVSFDASLLDIFVTLALGARLVVPKPDAFTDIPYVAEQIRAHGVTVLHMVPSMLSTLLLLPQTDAWRRLRLVPVGGEALPGDVADRFADYFGARLRNHYGPTEAVVCSTYKAVEGAQGSGVVPIGVPNRNVYAYVLDEELQPVPAGVVGELYLGGAQLARGYLGRPGLTAQRFVADPFSAGQRLYRSGDLVRRNESGDLEFVGRTDEQVKVRGYRIELGEVEAVLASHPAVRHCHVLVTESDIGPMLAAYVVADESGAAPLDMHELRAHAAATLPDYMVPAAYAVMAEIPLTVSGKLDKRALPAPTRIAGRGYREPTTATERTLCAIFARLFGAERVGADDSFFDLGGHSLLAARLVAQIRTELDVDVNVRAVFDTPTPAGLAAQLGRTTPASRRPALTGAGRPDRPPLSYSQLAMWFQHRLRGPNDVFNLALSLRIDGPLDVAALTAAINDVVARHEALRTTFSESDGVPYQLVHPTLPVALQLAEAEQDTVDEKVAELRRHLFALETGPLIKPTLLSLGSGKHLLLLLVHHIVTDHASLGVLFEDLVDAYRARVDGVAPQWDTTPLQFVDYALWQREAFDASSPWGRAALEYWSTALAGLPEEIAIAADHARPAVLGTRAQVATFAVPASRRAALVAFAERIGASEFMVYQAALAVLLHKLGGGDDIPIGSPVASRIDLSAADSEGPFANVVVLRNDLSGDPSLRSTVMRSRDVVLDALAHQELPIDRLVEALNPRRSTSRNHPLFQTSIHFRGDDWALRPVEMTGQTSVVPVSLDFEVSLLDLNIGMDVTADGGLEVRVVANADLYEADTARHIGDGLITALDAFATTPDTPLSQVQLLPPAVMDRLLSPPTAGHRDPAQPLGPGSPETEKALIALLAELLDIDDVDREDNFFALGGDSIIAVQLSARATAQGLALTPLMVFEHMTVAELAAAVDAGLGQLAAETDSAPASDGQPVDASGLDADAMAALTASWHNQT